MRPGRMVLSVDSIVVPDGRRALRDVTPLAQSIAAVGLINPITVTEKGRLVSGLHRLEACRKLGKSMIEANVVTMSEVDRQIVEIDENLIRNELDELERAEALYRRKQLYEAKYPRAKHGGAQPRRGPGSKGGKERNNHSLPDGSVTKFTKTVAETLRCHPTVIQNSVRIAKDLPEDVRAKLRGTPFADRAVDLYQMTRLSEATQRICAEEVASGRAFCLREAIAAADITDEERAKVLPHLSTPKPKRAVQTPRHRGPRRPEVDDPKMILRQVRRARMAWEDLIEFWRETRDESRIETIKAYDLVRGKFCDLEDAIIKADRPALRVVDGGAS